MPAKALTGSRIRERRLALGLRQTALARTVGISAAYLNLIEHNRRRIGGKLLVDLARALDVDPAALTEGAEVTLVATLMAAAAARPEAGAETDRAEDLAGRYGGWARLIADQHQHIESQQQIIAALTDRLTHDPQLAASIHEVLSVVTSIRSTSAILADQTGIDAEWQARFHRNLYEDSRRLAESAQALVEYLDSASGDGAAEQLTLPQDELEAWLRARRFHIAELEHPATAAPEDVLAAAPTLGKAPATAALALQYFRRYRDDARALPAEHLVAARSEALASPDQMARRSGVDLGCVLRRLAALPVEGTDTVGLVSCDSSGTLTFRKQIDGFPLPRFGAACPLWPLFQSLSRPLAPVRALIEQSGHRQRLFQTYAIAQPSGPVAFDTPQVFEATMLIVAVDGAAPDDRQGALPVGSSCRICPRDECPARREPSILTGGF